MHACLFEVWTVANVSAATDLVDLDLGCGLLGLNLHRLVVVLVPRGRLAFWWQIWRGRSIGRAGMDSMGILEDPFSTSSVNVIEETPVFLVFKLTLCEVRGYEDGEPLGTPLLSLSCQQK